MVYKDDGKITSSQIKLAVGGLRFDQDIVGGIDMGWTLTPSLGLVAKDIAKLGLDIRSFKVPLEKSIKEVMIPSFRKNFLAGGRPERWKPLADYTMLVRGNSGPILVRSGRLRKVSTQFKIWTVGRESATIKSLPDDVWYGALHQEGTGGFGTYLDQAKKALGRDARPSQIMRAAFNIMDKTRGGAAGHRPVAIPQRQFILFQEDDIDDIQQIFYEWLVERTIVVGRFTK
jgi:phage gpG-like protein